MCIILIASVQGAVKALAGEYRQAMTKTIRVIVEMAEDALDDIHIFQGIPPVKLAP